MEVDLTLKRSSQLQSGFSVCTHACGPILLCRIASLGNFSQPITKKNLRDHVCLPMFILAIYIKRELSFQPALANVIRVSGA